MGQDIVKTYQLGKDLGHWVGALLRVLVEDILPPYHPWYAMPKVPVKLKRTSTLTDHDGTPGIYSEPS